MTVHDVFVLAITLVTGLLGMGLTQWVKNKLGAQDKSALFLAGVVAGAMALGELVLTGQLNLLEVNMANWTSAFTAVFSLATVFYKLLLADTSSG